MPTAEQTMDRLSFEKIYYFPEHLGRLVAGEDAYPIHMQIGPVNYCNHDCTFCYAARTMFDAKKTPRTRIDVARLLEIVGEMQSLGLRAVTLVGAGEPTLHPQLADIIEGIGGMGVGVAMFTNGSCITDETAEAIAKHCTFVRFSMTGATPKIHNLVHRNDDFQRVVANIEKVVAARRGALPTLGSQFILASYSAPDVVAGAKLAKSLGLDYFEIKPCYVAPNKADQLENTLALEEARDLMEEARCIEDDTFTVYAKFEQVETVLHDVDDREYDDCPGHISSAVLEADLELYMCVNQKVSEFSFGSLEEVSFKEVWHGSRRRQILQTLDVHKCIPRCRQDPLNRIVHEIRTGARTVPPQLPIPEPHMHVDFV